LIVRKRERKRIEWLLMMLLATEVRKEEIEREFSSVFSIVVVVVYDMDMREKERERENTYIIINSIRTTTTTTTVLTNSKILLFDFHTWM